MVRRGRVSAMSAGSILPIISGMIRRFDVSRSATRAGAAPGSSSATSEKLTIGFGNSDTVAAPRMVGSSPVTARISAMTDWRTVSAGISEAVATSAAMPAAKTAAMTRLSRMRPVAEDTKGFSKASIGAADYSGHRLARNLGGAL